MPTVEPDRRHLGRLYIPDRRDEAFKMAYALPARAPGLTYRYWWPLGWWGDQGYTSQCVAYSWAHWLEDGPVTHDGQAPILDPANVYHQAQRIDEWPGEDYDGTSVRAGAKVLQSHGFIEGYLWAQSVDDVIKSLLTTGPVVAGTYWFEGMFSPDADHVIHPTGAISGGHAYLLNGVNTKRGILRLKNSWGRSWGNNGHAYISIDDFASLLDENGEACLAIEKKRS